MNEQAPENMSNTPISPKDILSYLQSNPNFLDEHPEACDYLIPPKAHDDKKIPDFQSYMIERLKSDKNEAIETTKEVVSTVRNNMNNQARIHRAILRLLEASSFENFVHAITIDLISILDVDITVLLVESNEDDIPHIQANGVRIIPQGTIDHWLGKKTSLLESDIQGVEAIYGGGATLVRSQALVRVDISMDTPPALLAFGSRDSELFQDGQGTEQISFLARVVERLFRLWLNIPV
ncbi:MAG: DUF484 family protein [Alphaproteobacteria bacterium]|nr:DUF484 family protein [Alphaproteobacteria bacterium]